MSIQVCNWTCQTSHVCSFRTNIRVKSGKFSYRPVSTSLMNSISKLRERFLMIFGALESWKFRVYNTLNAKRQFPKQLCPWPKTCRNRYRIRVQTRRYGANITTKNRELLNITQFTWLLANTPLWSYCTPNVKSNGAVSSWMGPYERKTQKLICLLVFQ